MQDVRVRLFITLCEPYVEFTRGQRLQSDMVHNVGSTMLQGRGGGSGLYFGGLLILIIAFLLGYWVYKDAGGRGKDNALLWGLGVGILTLLTLIGGLLALGFYIYTRD